MNTKIFEFVATIQCSAVIAAPDEATARQCVETWERAWFETGEIVGVVDVDLTDVRPAPKTREGQDDVAHIVLTKRSGQRETPCALEAERDALRARLDGFADPVDAAITIIVAHEAALEDLTRRLAEAELEACEAIAGAHAEQEVSRHWKQEAEYQKARVMEWARGRCCTCSGMTEDKYGNRNLYTEKCYGCSEYTGGEDGEPNLWEPAWEVKS